MSDDKNSEKDSEAAEIINLAEYRKQVKWEQSIWEALEELEDISDTVYEEYSEEEQLGYERYKRLLEMMLEKKADDDEESTEKS